MGITRLFPVFFDRPFLRLIETNTNTPICWNVYGDHFLGSLVIGLKDIPPNSSNDTLTVTIWKTI